MPWDALSARNFTKKAKSPAAKRQWAATADAVLAKSGDERKAVRIANAAIKRRRKKK